MQLTNMTYLTRSLTGTLCLFATVTALSAGCAQHSAAAPPSALAVGTEASNEPDEVTAGLIEHHRFHHHGGATLFIAMSLDTLGVSPEQRVALANIRGALHARMEAARLAEQRLITVLADGLVAGNVDQSKVDAAMLQVSSAAETVHEATADAMNELHAVLTPLQRGALADKMEAHWHLWQQANLDDNRSTNQDMSSLAMITEELSLTNDEADKIRAGLGERMTRVTPLAASVVDTRLRAFGDAFRGDAFDAKNIPSSIASNEQLAAWGAAHMTNLVEAAVLVLTVEQRTKLATHLREHAAHGANLAGSL